MLENLKALRYPRCLRQSGLVPAPVALSQNAVTALTQDCISSIVVLQNQRCLVPFQLAHFYSAHTTVWQQLLRITTATVLLFCRTKDVWCKLTPVADGGWWDVPRWSGTSWLCRRWRWGERKMDACNPQAKGFSWLGSGWCCWWSCWPPIWADCQWENSPCWLLQWLRGPFWWQWSQLNLGNDLNVIGVSDRSSVFAEEKCLGKENMQSWPKSQQPGWKRSCRQMRRWELSSGDQTLSSQYHF